MEAAFWRCKWARTTSPAETADSVLDRARPVLVLVSACLAAGEGIDSTIVWVSEKMSVKKSGRESWGICCHSTGPKEVKGS